MERRHSMIGWMLLLHWRRWSMYRGDVFMWHVTIWFTLLIQATVMYAMTQAAGGDIFGYTSNDLITYFAMAILATGMAQSVVQGIVIHIGRAVHTGQFDSWLLHPVPLFVRMLLEDIGLVWFWPHLFVGSGLLIWVLPAAQLPTAFVCSILAAVVEAGIMVSLSSFAMRWSMWNPEVFLWDYLEQSRSAPVLRSGSRWLMIASFGVLQYSLAIEVVTGRIPLLLLLLAASLTSAIAALCIRWNASHYASASG